MKQKTNHREIGIKVIFILLSVSVIVYALSFNLDISLFNLEQNKNVEPVKVQDDSGFDVFIYSHTRGGSLIAEFYHNSESSQPISVIGLKNYQLTREEASKNEKILISAQENRIKSQESLSKIKEFLTSRRDRATANLYDLISLFSQLMDYLTDIIDLITPAPQPKII